MYKDVYIGLAHDKAYDFDKKRQLEWLYAYVALWKERPV